jgi:hypothetical protein
MPTMFRRDTRADKLDRAGTHGREAARRMLARLRGQA